jgi:hypothetical protein
MNRDIEEAILLATKLKEKFSHANTPIAQRDPDASLMCASIEAKLRDGRYTSTEYDDMVEKLDGMQMLFQCDGDDECVMM